MATISTAQDERNQHAVIITIDGEERVYFRWHTANVVNAVCATLQRDGNAADCWATSAPAVYRTTKAGRRLLVAA
jgi:hypothetical protein